MLPSWEGRPRRPILVAAEYPGHEVGPAAGGPEAWTRPGAEGGAGELTASRRVAPRRAASPTKGAPMGGRHGGGAPGGPGQRSRAEAALRFCRGTTPPPGRPACAPARPAPRPAAPQLPPAHTRARAPGAGARLHASPGPGGVGGWGPACARPPARHLHRSGRRLGPYVQSWGRPSETLRVGAWKAGGLGSPPTKAAAEEPGVAEDPSLLGPEASLVSPSRPRRHALLSPCTKSPEGFGGRTCCVFVVERGTGTGFQAGSAAWSPLALEAPCAQEDKPSLPLPECLGAVHSMGAKVRPRTSSRDEPVPFRLPGWAGEMPSGGGGL